MSEPLVERPAMTDYGVPTEAEGALPWSWASERLARSRNFWVVTADGNGRPHAMPVWGVWRDDVFWFSCSPNARKARNLAVNPQMTVTADDTVEVVVVEGRARLVPGSEAGGAIDAYVAKYWPGEDPGPHGDFLRSHAVYVMSPERGFGIIEREEEFSTKATRWRWS